MSFDLVLKNSTIVNASNVIYPPNYIGIKDEKIACISLTPLEGDRTIDCEGAFVTPGGIDAHVHIEQHTTDTFPSATGSSICGGTTTVVAFAPQDKKKDTILEDLEVYFQKHQNRIHCDLGLHLILSNPTPTLLQKELPLIVQKYGITSVKVYMTYETLRITDGQILQVLTTARKLGITVMIHAENKDVIDFLIEKFEKEGLLEPVYHSNSRPFLAEDEASYRAISLSKLADQSILIVHMSAKTALDHVCRAQKQNFPVYAETCPQYLFLTTKYLASHAHETAEEVEEAFQDYNIKIDAHDHFQGAKYICSPPLRDTQEELDGVWEHIMNGTVTIFSSDHAPVVYDDYMTGKKIGIKTGFAKVPNGMPGVETRLPLLWCYGVETGRISPQRFVEVTSTNPAKLYGLHKRKGAIEVGLDADIVIWYPKGKENFKLTNDILHHDMDYTPFEGMSFNNWPRYTILRGKIVWDRDGEGKNSEYDFCGKYLKREKSAMQASKSSSLPKFFY